MATPIVFIFVSCILNDGCWTQKHLGPALCIVAGRSFGNHHVMTYRVCLQVMFLTSVVEPGQKKGVLRDHFASFGMLQF